MHNMCKIWNFYDEMCAQEGCPHMTDNTNDDTQRTIQDYTDRLFGIYAQ